MPELPRYDRQQSYDWNYQHAPGLESLGPADATDLPMPGDWTFCGRSVASPLGVSAGPLLNGRWVLYYAALGFDILTYKTVRSQSRASYPLPNLAPVATRGPIELEIPLEASGEMRDSWAISFGMPSQPVDRWQEDVAWTRKHLPSDKLLSVSVVATPSPDWTIEQVAADYARCAGWAVDSGADAVELNFSCPNVTSCDGQLYQEAQHAEAVAATVRERVPGVPLIVKIGHVRESEQVEIIIQTLTAYVDALSMVNCLAARVMSDGRALFDNEPRGIGGNAIFAQSLAQVHTFAKCIERVGSPLEIIGVGGISSASHAAEYLRAGAKSVQLATAPMCNPAIAQQIKRSLAETL